MNILNRLVKQREFMIFCIVLVMFIVMSFASPHFLSYQNLLGVLLGLSFEALIAVAMVMLMVSGGFDMSVGSVVAFTGSLVAVLMRSGVPIPLSILVALTAGACIGLFNGFIVAKVGINPFVTTLAGLSIFRGLTLIITGGRNISPLPDVFNMIGQTRFGPVQTPILFMLFFVILGDIFLRRSRFFRRCYYIGGNEKAAGLSGIPVAKMKMFCFMLTGLFAGIAGVIMASRLGTASVTAGTGLELRVITAVIIGGASLRGGEGTVLGAFLGSFLMALIMNALTLLRVDVYWHTFVIGATLLTAVLIDRFGKIRSEKNLTKTKL